MAETFNHITDLIYRSLADELPVSEQAELDGWLNASVKRREWYESLADHGLQEAMQRTTVERQSAMEEMHTRIRVATGISALRDGDIHDPIAIRPVHRVHFLKTAWFRYAAAVIIIFGVGAYLWNTQNNSRTLTETRPVPIKNDVLPGGQKAMLTLADGRQIVLDSAQNGQLALENGSEVIKKDGAVIYDAGQIRGHSVTYNTMSTPKGGQYQLTLIDGTKVWLNAASSITYPTLFNGKTREVVITGEVYFEVTKNAKMPFVVKTDKENITVLGTSFNVNSYTDEPKGKVSLIDGAVKVNEQLLQPGQAYVEGKIINTNTTQDVAWKNGAFNFNNLTLEQAARQIGRWYDVAIQFEGPIPKTEIYGGVSRTVTLQRLIQEMEGEFAHFSLQ